MKMEFSIREAGLPDAETISQLSYQLGYEVPVKETEYNLEAITANPDEIVYVALHEEKLIAWIHIFHTTRLESGSFCELGGLVVDEQYRSNGIGRLLVDRAKEWCISRKVPVLRLRSNIIRNEAHRFYQNLGFREIKQQKIFEIIMKLE